MAHLKISVELWQFEDIADKESYVLSVTSRAALVIVYGNTSAQEWSLKSAHPFGISKRTNKRKANE